jgi:hypothetical protein
MMKKFAVAVVAALVLLVVAAPVMAGKPVTYPAGLEMPDENNLGCSGAFWDKKLGFTQFSSKADPRLKGMDLEYAVAYLNWEVFGQIPDTGLDYDEIDAVYLAWLDASKQDEKGYVEYLKLWNKGFLAEDGSVVKTCPSLDDPVWDGVVVVPDPATWVLPVPPAPPSP